MQKCRKCDKLGHTYEVCNSPPTDSTEKAQPSGEKPYKDAQPRKHQSHFVESEDQAFELFTAKSSTNSGILVNLSINETPIAMTLDTGASISIISERKHTRQSYHNFSSAST